VAIFGIITAHKTVLTQEHLAAIHIDQYALKIIGMEAYEEFSSVFSGGKQMLLALLIEHNLNMDGTFSGYGAISICCRICYRECPCVAVRITLTHRKFDDINNGFTSTWMAGVF
jgi:hypothetical protein